MLTLIEDAEQSAKAQKRIVETIRREFNTTLVKNIGYPGGTTRDARIFTNGKHWFWSSDHHQADAPNPRRLNWFGILREGTHQEITVEVNTVYSGRNDQVAGFFARDSRTGAVYLLHSGRVGGGTKGVGKTAFLAWSNQLPVDAIDSSGDARDGVVVMPVEGISATRSAVRYVDTIARFKGAVRSGEIRSTEFRRRKAIFEKFYSEGRGRRTGTRSREIDYFSRHGDVVDSVRSWRESQPLPLGARVVKNIFIDLGVEAHGKLLELYEVKTSTARSDLYAAVGQLLVHGNSSACKRVLVLPEKEVIAPDLCDAMDQLQIEIRRFKLHKSGATIV